MTYIVIHTRGYRKIPCALMCIHVDMPEYKPNKDMHGSWKNSCLIEPGQLV